MAETRIIRDKVVRGSIAMPMHDLVFASDCFVHGSIKARSIHASGSLRTSGSMLSKNEIIVGGDIRAFGGIYSGSEVSAALSIISGGHIKAEKSITAGDILSAEMDILQSYSLSRTKRSKMLSVTGTICRFPCSPLRAICSSCATCAIC